MVGRLNREDDVRQPTGVGDPVHEKSLGYPALYHSFCAYASCVNVDRGESHYTPALFPLRAKRCTLKYGAGAKPACAKC